MLFRRILLLTVWLASSNCAREADRRFVTPRLAAQPSRFVAIAGQLQAGVELALQVQYQTTDARCAITVDWLAGVTSPRIYQHDVPLRRRGDRYEASLPLDAVGETTCGWVPFSINYIVTVGGRRQTVPLPPAPLFWFRDGGAASLPPFAVSCRGSGAAVECSRPLGEYVLSLTPEPLQVDFNTSPAAVP